MPSLIRSKLKCFYCGTRSVYSKGVPSFVCASCEATNHLDANGEITDPPAAAPSTTTYATASPVSQDTTLFCPTCIQNQHLLTSCLANYLPPESDPNYALFETEYPAYRASLEQRYPPVCFDCEPRVRARLKASAHVARTDALSKSLGRASVKHKRPRLALVAPVWWLSLLVQVVWHGSRLFGSSELDAIIPYSLCAGAAVCWWRPALGARVTGVRDFYTTQALVLCLRAASWEMIQRTQREDMRQAIHAFMIVFLLAATIVSFNAIKAAPSPSFRFRDLDLNLVDKDSFQPPKKVLSRPERQFTIDRLAPRAEAQAQAQAPPSPPDSDGEDDGRPDTEGMDWEPLPSQPHFTSRSNTSATHTKPEAASSFAHRVEPPGISNPSPFYGRLPPAPRSLESKLRNKANAPPTTFRPVSHAEKADWFRKLRLSSPAFPAAGVQPPTQDHLETGHGRDGVVGRVEDDEARTLRLAAPKWTLASDREEALRGTGLEDLFGTSFRIRDEPGVVRSSAAAAVVADGGEEIRAPTRLLWVLLLGLLPVVVGFGVLAWQSGRLYGIDWTSGSSAVRETSDTIARLATDTITET